MIDLYAAGTSNGMRARIALEECGLKYNWHPIDLTKGEHKTPQYLAMNPMGQIPVLIDNEGPGGSKITLAQSSAIMMYCAEKAGKFIPKDPAKKAAMLEAYMSASTDITPMFGSVNACVRNPNPEPYKQAAEMFTGFVEDIGRVLKKGSKIRIPNLGILQVRIRPARPARTGRNPLTGEEIRIKASRASKKVAFRVAKSLKEAI